jgi:2-methylcitrate dehydratase PrpD
MTPVAPTRQLATFVSNLTYDALSSDVRERVKDIVLDAAASALAGRDASENAKVVALARSLGSSTESTVIGGERLSPAGATLVNGYLITAVTVCDIHRPTSCHVTPEVVAPALAIAEERGSDGKTLLAAVAAGLEVTTRVGLGLDPTAFRARGWHAPGVTGPFGGAAAAGRLLGLSADEQCFAFGIAASQSAGTYAQLGTPTIKFQQSRGALSGLMSARLASVGFTAAEEILTHPDGGLFSAYADGGSPDVLLRDLGADWELLRISLRAWPVAVHLQPVVTGLLDLIKRTDIRPDAIAEVRLGISPTAYRMHGTVNYEDRFRARLSAPYVTGVVLFDRACWLDQFTPARVQDPALDQFIRERVHVSPDPALVDGTTSIELVTTGGAEHVETVAVAKGEPSNPLSRDDIIAKFRTAAAPHLSPDAIERMITMTTNLESVPNTQDLVGSLRRSVSES